MSMYRLDEYRSALLSILILRCLHVYRFYGRIAIEPNAHDEDTLKAIKEHMHGLQG